MAEQTTPAAAPSPSGADFEYGPSYYRHDCGIPYERNEHWLGFFGEVADGIVRDLHPTSVLDAGCAWGFLVEALHARGVDAYGMDISEYAISQVDESVRDRCTVGSLTEPLPRRYDLIVCIEVVEHVPPEHARQVIANLCAHTDRLLLSTSPRDYGEATHMNVQPAEQWSAMLASEGFLREIERDFSYVTPWAALYTRREEPLEETVRAYDRAWSRSRQESQELRTALLTLREHLAALEARDQQPANAELTAKIDEQREEIMRLRDLLVGRDAELGSLRGSIAAHEEQSRRLVALSTRIQERIPGSMRLIGRVLRLLQGRR